MSPGATIELACIADGAYLRHTGAMLHSALSRTPGARFAITVLHGSPVGEDDRARMAQVVAPFGATLQFRQLDDAMFPGGYFPRAIWLRILLPELLPHADKVLYLDSDLIVADDLRPLWDTDLGDALLGAVTNPFYPFMPDHPKLHLGIEDPADYLNSGVLLMSLARMRAEGTSAKLVEFARSRPGNPYPDQDALNDVCRGRWLHLHPRWNVQSTLFELPARVLPLPAAQVEEARTRPAVVHYIGPFKPWHYLCRHPLQHLYFEHARATPWGAPALEGVSLRNAILKRLPLAWIDFWFRAERAAARLWRRAFPRAAVSAG